MPNFEFQPRADPTNSNPRNNFHQHVHIHQHVTQGLGGIKQPVLEPFSFPNQAVIKEGKYMVDVVFVKDPANFFCQFVENSANVNALLEELASSYSGKELSLLSYIFLILFPPFFLR